MFDKVLIANRGEIAVRIARTCRRLGVATVAVHSDADATAVHVEACDEAIRLPGTTPAETYLHAEAVLAAARRTGAEAIHPGYGFLSEDAAFARAVDDAGLGWVGPPASAIEAMGDKITAKATMAQASVPLVAGETVDGSDAVEAAERIGFPLLVKASAGGGGRGMRVVTSPDDLDDAIASARREAAAAFGDDRVFLERRLTRARHVEVQVLADAHGNVVHLLERECSIQRRHQKVIEEAPSPGIDDEVRAAMCDAAVAAARAIDYVGAGTVELIVDGAAQQRRQSGEALAPEGVFAFLEMNTRLQVEHPVTEESVRIDTADGPATVDLVELQLRVAAGERLPFAQRDVARVGHAMEARVYAEDTEQDYLPAAGTLETVTWAELPGVRYDAGVRSGDVISPHYDPMLAKVIASAPTRDRAAARLAGALEQSVLLGTTTNQGLLVQVLRDEAFLAGETTTDFLDERFADPASRRARPAAAERELALVAATIATAAADVGAEAWLPALPVGFSNGASVHHERAFVVEDGEHHVRYRQGRDGRWELTLDDEPRLEVRAVPLGGGRLDLEVARRRSAVWVDGDGPTRSVRLPTGRIEVEVLPRFVEVEAAAAQGVTLAPMPGSVVEVAVTEGEEVVEGRLLVTVEAMKMEHRITAPFGGHVEEVRVTAGQQVDSDQVLVVVVPASSSDD